MQVLHDLIHTLAKEEKRLYQIHKREGRFQKIYETYLRTSPYNKDIDQQIYAAHFSDVSRAFYSMQKRALMDDILTVLLEYSNNNHPGYQYIRLFSRASVLLERKLGQAAFDYAREAYEVAEANDEPMRAAAALRVQQQAMALTTDPSLREYEQLNEMQLQLFERGRPDNVLERVEQALRLLRHNADQEPLEVVLQKAHTYIQEIEGIGLEGDTVKHQLERLQCLELYHDILGNPEGFHKEITAFYKRVSNNGALYSPQKFYNLTNHFLQSGLRSGDFLMLSSLIYKLDKQLPALDKDVRQSFLPGFYENAALFSFYENDLPAAIRMIQHVLQSDGLGRAQTIRCVIYRMAMLLAAHLPHQALEEIQQYKQQIPELEGYSLLWLIEILCIIDNNQDSEDTLYQIERYKNILKKRKDSRELLDTFTLLGTYIEKRRVKERPVQLLPQGWENILRVDYWLRAKQEKTKFYYNLIVEDWQQRRKVY